MSFPRLTYEPWEYAFYILCVHWNCLETDCQAGLRPSGNDQIFDNKTQALPVRSACVAYGRTLPRDRCEDAKCPFLRAVMLMRISYQAQDMVIPVQYLVANPNPRRTPKHNVR